MLQMLLEDKWKISKSESARLSLYFTECNGILAVHFLYLMHGWKCTPSRSQNDSLPSLSDVVQVVQHVYVPPMLLCSVAVVSLSISDCNSWYYTMHLQTCILSTDFQQSAEDGKVLFTDESCVVRTGMANIHSEILWSEKNPHAVSSRQEQ